MNKLWIVFLLVANGYIQTSNASSTQEILANARIVILENEHFVIRNKIACAGKYKNLEDRFSCFERIRKEHPNRFIKPDSLDAIKAAVVEPTPESIEEKCGDLPRIAAPGSYHECASNEKVRYYQSLALIRAGMDPTAYHDPDFQSTIPDDLKIKIKNLEDSNFTYRDFLGEFIRVQWTGGRCDAKGQTEAWNDRPTCDRRENFVAPDGYQFCRLAEWDEHATEGARVDDPEYILFDEENGLLQEQRKIKGLYTKLHAAGGPWHDKYKSSAQIKSATLEFVPFNSSPSVRKLFKCDFLEPIVDADTPVEDEIPYMDVSISIRRSASAEHSGTVSITAKGTPPWEVYYEVEAFRKDGDVAKWHKVGNEKVKFEKPNNEYSKDWNWHKATAWRLKNVAY